MRVTFAAALVVATLAHASGVAHAGTEYVYRVDGVVDLTIYADGATAVAEIPSIVRVHALEQLGIPLRPQRMIYRAEGKTFLLVDDGRKKYVELAKDRIELVKSMFLQRYVQSRRTELDAMSPADRHKVEQRINESYAHPNGVTLFGAAKGKQKSVSGGECEALDYVTDDKPSGTVCSVPFSEVWKQPSPQALIREADALFGVIVGLELFKVAMYTSAPGLVAEIATAPGVDAHSLKLVRVSKNVQRPKLLDLTGYESAADLSALLPKGR